MDKALTSSTTPQDNAKTPLVFGKHCQTTVYIWDLDETLILLKSLLDGTYAKSSNGLKDSRKGIQIGKNWEDHILQGKAVLVDRLYTANIVLKSDRLKH